MGVKESIEAVAKPLETVVVGFEKNVTDGMQTTKEVITGVVDTGEKLVLNGESIIGKTESDLISTVQFGLFGIGLAALLFISNTSGDKLADVVIEPSKTVGKIVTKI